MNSEVAAGGLVAEGGEGGEEDKVFARLKWAFSAAIQTHTFLEGPLYLRLVNRATQGHCLTEITHSGLQANRGNVMVSPSDGTRYVHAHTNIHNIFFPAPLLRLSRFRGKRKLIFRYYSRFHAAVAHASTSFPPFLFPLRKTACMPLPSPQLLYATFA